MNKLPEVVPVTDLRQDATTILKRVKSTNKPLIITQRGRASAVMLSMAEYEKSIHQLEILKLLAQGEKEIQAGNGFSLASVLKEADELLKE